MMDIVDRTAVFFYAHPKRQTALEAAIDRTDPSSSSRKIKDLCRTRWVQRLDAFESFLKPQVALVSCLQQILDDTPQKWSRDSITDGNGILTAKKSIEFISCLVIANNC